MTKHSEDIYTCHMCGRLVTRLVARWYVYDNGQKEINYVCTACADQHARLVKAGR